MLGMTSEAILKPANIFAAVRHLVVNLIYKRYFFPTQLAASQH